MTENCANCKYSRPCKTDDRVLECHRYPKDQSGFWRWVEGDDWCGEWAGPNTGKL